MTVHIPFGAQLATLAPFFALGVLLLVRKANRNWRAWMIFLPVVALYGLWLLVERIGLISGLRTSAYSVLFETLVFAIAAVLVNHASQSYARGFRKAVHLVLTIAGMSLLTGISCGGFFTSEVVSVLISATIYVCCMLLAMTLAVRGMREKLDLDKFALRLLLWLPVSTVVLLELLLQTLGLFQSTPAPGAFTIAMIVGSVAGGLSWCLFAPFLLLASRNRLYRQRLHALLGAPE